MTFTSKAILYFVTTFAVLALVMNVIVSKTIHETPLPKTVSKLKLYCLVWLIPYLGPIYVHSLIHKGFSCSNNHDAGEIPGWLSIGYKNDHDYDND